ncbi:MAG TPA: ATPase [Clostridiales bacterium]|nr:MAG: ATPase [Clostridiales bacterium GWD2_32_19]HCC08149.1 ATPase [Clostridiales bacterium]
MKENNTYHIMSVEDIYVETGSNSNGLTQMEAESRIVEYGKNQLDEGKRKTLLGKYLDQFKDFMVIVLIVAGVISGALGELTDMGIILVVVIINAVLGVIQENKAEKALEALKKMSSPQVKVKRNGEVEKIDTENLVFGDLVLVEAGDFIPADMRIIEIANLKIDESALTGESVPVEKSVSKLENADVVIGDRINMAYSGSIVTYGRGLGVVTGTGMNTEVGKIAKKISDTEDNQTPLQMNLDKMGKMLSIAVLIIAALIFVVGILNGRDTFEMFLTSVSLAVAAIPEGLPAVITIVLAIGVQKMAKKNAIIRKLAAVETLGSTEIICSDKTGTLTQNKMTVKEVYINRQMLEAKDIEGNHEHVREFIHVMTLCNDSKVVNSEENTIKLLGDPTETALISFAHEKGFNKNELDNISKRVDEIPFDSDRKLMTTIHGDDASFKIMTKGAPDVLLQRCTKILVNGEIENLSEDILKEINSSNKMMASKALRVLAFAYNKIEIMPEDMTSMKVENDLVFVGLVGMIDPPREEAKEAIRECKSAGIRAIMITGDHKDTAVAIAKELGIITDESEAITGTELDKISDKDFLKLVTKYSVYARVSPEHKVRIVETWQKNGRIVAMTGDGVNDAPALKTADIGVGMGITGTDVSKSVSNMVLADDNFATIVYAVKEGRKIYSNITKTIQFLLSSNLGEVVTLFLATMLNWVVLFPIHILWINLVTDSLPALALGVEKSEKDVMKQKPRKADSSFWSNGVGFNIIYQGISKGLITLSVYYIGDKLYSHEVAMTMTFITLGLIQLTHSINVRSNKKSIFEIGLFSNMYLIWAILITAFLQIIVVVVPPIAKIFKVVPLNFEQWSIVLLASFAIIPIVEIVKIVVRSIDKNKVKN